MKSRILLFCIATGLAAQAQTASKPATTSAKTPVHTTAAASSAVKLPPGVPPARGIVRTVLSLRYQDIKVGTGPVGEENKLWHVKYTGWRAADGVKFDSWEDHRMPVMGPDGKPKLGADNKPVLGDPVPLEFPHAVGRMIPGFDIGIEGMRVGGKRRLFVPWALAYGYRNIPDRGPDHPGIPAKSDLIFDVELVGVTEIPQRPMVPPGVVPQGVTPHPVPPINSPAAPAQPAAPATAAPATAPATPPQQK